MIDELLVVFGTQHGHTTANLANAKLMTYSDKSNYDWMLLASPMTFVKFQPMTLCLLSQRSNP